jgi:hypothetical protein
MGLVNYTKDLPMFVTRFYLASNGWAFGRDWEPKVEKI